MKVGWGFIILLSLASMPNSSSSISRRTNQPYQRYIPLRDDDNCDLRCAEAFHAMLPKGPVPPSGPSPDHNSVTLGKHD